MKDHDKRSSAIRIGFLGFRTPALEIMPPLRRRAMLAEAVLQGARFEIIDSIASKPGALSAYCWTGTDWELSPVTPQSVVFIMGAGVKPEQREVSEYVQQESVCIHDIGLNKLNQTILFQGSEARPYVIPTERLLGDGLQAQVLSFLQRHDSAVIKRSDANQGVGLLFILRDGDAWRIVQDQKVHRGKIDEVSELVARKIAGRMSYRDYLIQKFVPSHSVDDRPVDIRVHVQRNGSGDWQVTRAYARLGEMGRQAANVSKGGYQGALSSFLKGRHVRKAGDIEAELHAAALLLADVQSASAPRPLSELGIDFLLDQDDKIWLIETNALPQSSLHEQQRAMHSIAYALSLASSSTLAVP